MFFQLLQSLEHHDVLLVSTQLQLCMKYKEIMVDLGRFDNGRFGIYLLLTRASQQWIFQNSEYSDVIVLVFSDTEFTL